MIAETWAREFRSGALIGQDTRRHIDLHVADTAVAFFAGHASPEAKALGRFFSGKTQAAADHRAAAIAAMIRRTECDDIHVASCITAGSIIIPVALAFSAESCDRETFDPAVAAGYAAGLRIGSALGGAAALGTGIWPTYFAAPIIAAATASVAFGLDEKQIMAALGLAAAGAGGRLGRISGSPSGRWLALGEAVGKGCRAAMAAARGFQADTGLISPDWLASLADPKFARPECLLGGPGIEAVGLKPIVAARQVINAVVAFRTILEHGVDPLDIERIEVGVPPIHAAMVAKPAIPGDRLSTIANMHAQIATAALNPELLCDIERDGQPTEAMVAYGRKVEIVSDETLHVHLPDVWAARVKVIAGGREFEEVCTNVPGDASRRDAAGLVEMKLQRMVPARYQPTCRLPSLGIGEYGRSKWRGGMWREMVNILDNI